jgi:hypothetical protein
VGSYASSADFNAGLFALKILIILTSSGPESSSPTKQKLTQLPLNIQVIFEIPH